MKITKEEYAVQREKAKANLASRAQSYGVSLENYWRVNLQHASLEEAIEWEITVIAYGLELHPGAGVQVCTECNICHQPFDGIPQVYGPHDCLCPRCHKRMVDANQLTYGGKF